MRFSAHRAPVRWLVRKYALVMPRDYYSDAVQGPRALTEDTVDEQLWSAIFALLERSIATHVLAEDFPLTCEDGGLAYATDRAAVMQTIAGEIPNLPSPLAAHPVPPTLSILDLLEFLQRHASKATRLERHGYFRHDHLRFDREFGQRRDARIDQPPARTQRPGLRTRPAGPDHPRRRRARPRTAQTRAAPNARREP